MGCVKRREALCALFMAAAPEGERAPDTLQHDPIHNNPHATTQAQQGKAEREVRDGRDGREGREAKKCKLGFLDSPTA